MNYRHAFHAGNHADVLKHSVLLGLIAALQRKPSPLFVLDTHAGRGAYDLAGDEALRSGEAQAGVQRLWQLPPQSALLAAYLAALKCFDASEPARRYPGSPCLLQQALRADDRLACCELHPQEAASLRAAIGRDARVAVHARDGYEAIRGLLPPAQARGLVLIDPPYESREAEFELLLTALAQVLARWATAAIAVWYPLKDHAAVGRFLRRAADLNAHSAWHAELMVDSESPLRMNGSGMLLLNPPWQLDQDLRPALMELADLLGEQGRGRSHLRWLRRDGARCDDHSSAE